MKRVLLLVVMLGLAACEPRAGASAGHRGGDAPLPASGSASAAVVASASASGSSSPPAPTVRLKAGGRISSDKGMVSSEDPHASRAGAEILAAGGNAVDAAVAVAYALAVTHHGAGSLGGGGFMIVHLASGETKAVDYREIAPAKATVKLNEKQLSKGAHGYLSAPVPGVVAGLELARETFGSLPREKLIAPAIKLARDGHKYGMRQGRVLGWYFERLQKDPTMKAVLGRGPARNKPVKAGQLLKQPRLGDTLEAIAKDGFDGFYKGEVAKKIAAAMRNGGGLVTEADLAGYRAKLREPLRFRYRGFDVVTMPPPSMGGVALAVIMMNLAQVDAHEAPAMSAPSMHFFVEAAKRAYADRRAVGADPDRVDPALVGPRRTKLLDPRYHAEREPKIVADAATPSATIVPLAKLLPAPKESPETTHFSVVDAAGNAVACTTTLSAGFGSWKMVPGTGVILSNAMGAFSPDGVNTLAPGKRMASSMTPTILLQNDKAVAVVGSPGGDTIPSTVAQLVYHLIDHGMTIDEAIETGRVHHQWRPDVVRVEKRRAAGPVVLAALRKLGHDLKLSQVPLGDANGIVVDAESGVAYGHADTRKGGLAIGPASISR